MCVDKFPEVHMLLGRGNLSRLKAVFLGWGGAGFLHKIGKVTNTPCGRTSNKLDTQ